MLVILAMCIVVSCALKKQRMSWSPFSGRIEAKDRMANLKKSGKSGRARGIPAEM